MTEISIVTVSYNPGDVIAHCLESVRNQSIRAEHIWVDGGSTDGTIEIINDYRGHKLERIIEPDRGMYDAMNKGIERATGSIIGILNADDELASSTVLERVVELFENPEIDACYGDLEYVAKEDRGRVTRRWIAGEYERKKFYSGWMPPHPTLFVRRSVYKEYGLFDPRCGSSSDYELILRLLLKHRINVKYIPAVMVRMSTGGVSNRNIINRLKAHIMDYKAWYINDIYPYPWTIPLKPLRKLPQWLNTGIG